MLIHCPLPWGNLKAKCDKGGMAGPGQATHLFNLRSILGMPDPYLDSSESLSLVKMMPLYARLREDRFPEITQAEV